MTSKNFVEFTESLEELIKLYRTLLETVRREREILVASRLDELTENNRTKEALLVKIRQVDGQRADLAQKVAEELGMPEQPRLLLMANRCGGEVGERWRNLHSVFDLLLKRVQDLNRQNETLVQAALENVTGAMNSIREVLQEKPTYQRRGEVNSPAAGTGQLVSREA